MKQLLIDLALLPEDGKALKGDLDASIFDLAGSDPKPLAPLHFDLYAQRFDNELLLQGSLSCPFEFECVRTLHPFVKTMTLSSAAISLEIGNSGEVDATEALREELLLELPNHPSCQIADEPRNCKIDPHYLAVDKDDEVELNPAPPEGGDSRWSALDAFRTDES